MAADVTPFNLLLLTNNNSSVKLQRNLESETTVNTAVAKYFVLHHEKLIHSFSQQATAESYQSPP